MSEEPTVRFHPGETTVSVEEGTTLLAAAERAGLSIESLCGGEGLCGTCKVVVDDGADCLSDPTDADEMLLSDEQLADGYRLSCRASVQGGAVETTVPSVSQNTGGVVLTEGHELEFDIDPAVKNYHLELVAPSLEDNVADLERVTEGLADAYDLDVDEMDHLVHRELPNDLRAESTDDTLDVTVTVYDETEVVDVTPGYDERRYGLAVDLGTTTLAVYLVDLQTGDRLAVSSRLNPQSKFGGDLMTRVRYTRRNDGGRQELQDSIVEGVNGCIDEVLTEADVAADRVYETVFVGNTAMHHLFLGLEPSYVAGSPYVAANHAPVQVKARELGLDVNPSGYVYWLPISGGWVGPDKVSVLLVAGHYKEDEMTVCIDIGTNGEISVGNAEKMWVTSAPAGPALEGAEITHGVRAQDGAIEAVSIDPETLEPTCEVIGGGRPNGICGSGVIDALAELFRTGVVDQRGQFRESLLDHPRLRRNEDDVVEYVLVADDRSSIDGDVVLTQNDIRQIQRAKAAIQAGTRVLMQELGVEEVDRVMLAGGFGNYIDPESAMTVGLYPDVALEKVESLGNAAGIGAQLALLNTDAREEAESIVDQVEYFEIAGTDVFQDNFMESMYLPHKDFDVYPRVRERVRAVRELDDAATTE
ncbi:ASKHA domain-containing protein [Halobacteriaceae archaeon GCM10025711]